MEPKSILPKHIHCRHQTAIVVEYPTDVQSRLNAPCRVDSAESCAKTSVDLEAASVLHDGLTGNTLGCELVSLAKKFSVESFDCLTTSVGGECVWSFDGRQWHSEVLNYSED